MKNAYLNDIMQRGQAVTHDVKATFGSLTGQQLNWKPHPDKWSVAQCLDHLIVSNTLYFPDLEKIARGERKSTLWEHMPLLPRLFGSMLISSLQKPNARPVKTRPHFFPSNSTISPSIIEDFARHQQKLLDLMRTTDHVNHEKTIITSAFAGFVTYSLKDCYTILILHEEHHVRQARHVMEMEGFPQNTI